MTGGDESDPVVEVLRENTYVKILFASFTQIKRINTEGFIPLVPSFGLLLYAFGMLITLGLLAVTFVWEVASDGLTLSDFSAAGTPLFLGLVCFYFIIYQIASQVNILTGDEDDLKSDKNFSTFQASALMLLGFAFWIVGFVLRVHFVPGIDPESYYSTILSNTAPAIGILAYSIAMDLVYIGMVLIGSGIIARGVYSIYGGKSREQ